MNSVKGIAIVLIAAGVVALAVGGFSYTKETHEAHIGSLDLSVKDKEHVNVPVWAGVAAIVIGAGFLLVPNNKT
jgi:TRAP-type C4-dicarboxylate transport system permease small subunit